jgi:hypothetical protein
MAGRKKKTGRKQKIPQKAAAAETRQTRRFLFLWLPTIVISLLVFYALAFDPARPVGPPVRGILSGSEGPPSDESAQKAYEVTLDDGRVIRLEDPHMGLQRGRRVIVEESRTLIFKRKAFTFVRYLERD